MINILIVEDDLNIAKGLKNLLSQIRENMNIHCEIGRASWMERV